jgi:hypothetical protein
MEVVTPEFLIFALILQNIISVSVQEPLDQASWTNLVRFAAETAKPLIAACRSLGVLASVTGQTFPIPGGAPKAAPGGADALELAKRFARGEPVPQSTFKTNPMLPLVTPLPTPVIAPPPQTSLPVSVPIMNGNGAEIGRLLSDVPPALRDNPEMRLWLESVRTALHMDAGAEHAGATRPADHQAGS